MCKSQHTNFRCGHRFVSAKTPCLYEKRRHSFQPACRYITLFYSRWDENGETHCEACREEIRKARPGRILAAKTEQLEAYELGIAEYIKNIDEHEQAFRRKEAEEDSSLEDASIQLRGGFGDSDEATTPTTETSEPEYANAENTVPYTPVAEETLEREIASHEELEEEPFDYRDIEDWIQHIEGDWKEEWVELNIKMEKARTRPLPSNVVPKRNRASGDEWREQRPKLMKMFADARERADKKMLEERLSRLKSMFAVARAKSILARDL